MTYSQKDKTSVAWLSVCSNSFLVVLKLSTGLIMGSMAMISEAIHSGMDLLASLIALVSVKTSSVPPDRRHSFGHEKIENLSGSLEAVLILAAAGWIIYESVKKLFNPEPVSLLGLGMAVMIFCIIVNLLVSRKLFQVGYDTESMALQGNAWHLRTDVYTSVGVLASFTLIMALQWLFPGTTPYWIDPLAALAVALIIGRAGWKLLLKALGDLLDARIPEEEEWIMHKLIESRQSSIHGYHHFRSRKAGKTRFIEFHLKVDPHMTVEDSHSLAEKITGDICGEFPGANVSIHVEPCDGRCRGENCPGSCFRFPEKDPDREGSP